MKYSMKLDDKQTRQYSKLKVDMVD